MNSKAKDTDNSFCARFCLPTNRYVTFIMIVGGGLAADLISKSYVFNHFFNPEAPGLQHWCIEGILGIQVSFNNGALFGMMQGFQWLFVSLSLLAVVGIILWLFLKKGASDWLMLVIMSFICAGILGNLYDRVGWGYKEIYGDENKHAVRDWIHFRWEGVSVFDPWPNFNIADSMLVCGAISLFLIAIFAKQTDNSRPNINNTEESDE